MKKMICCLLLFLLTAVFTGGPFLFAQPEPASKKEPGISFFSGKSLYFYALGSYSYFLPTVDSYCDLGDEGAFSLAPVLGIGFRLMNIMDRFFLNLECDYSFAEYDFEGAARNREIGLLTFMLNAEGSFSSRSPITVFGGFGIAVHYLSDLGYYDYYGDYVLVGDEWISAVSLGIGLKVRISRNFTFRSEFRFNGETYADYENDYYDEWWDEEWSNSDWNFISSSFSLGLEIHF